MKEKRPKQVEKKPKNNSEQKMQTTAENVQEIITGILRERSVKQNL